MRKIIIWTVGLMTATLFIGNISIRPEKPVWEPVESQIRYNKNHAVSVSKAMTAAEGEQGEVIQDGLYIVPDTQDYLLVKSDGEEIEFHADWGSIGSISSTAFLSKEKEYSFKNGDDEKGDGISGTLTFEDGKASLKINEELVFAHGNRIPMAEKFYVGIFRGAVKRNCKRSGGSSEIWM